MLRLVGGTGDANGVHGNWAVRAGRPRRAFKSMMVRQRTDIFLACSSRRSVGGQWRPHGVRRVSIGAGKEFVAIDGAKTFSYVAWLRL